MFDKIVFAWRALKILALVVICYFGFKVLNDKYKIKNPLTSLVKVVAKGIKSSFSFITDKTIPGR